MRFEKRTVLVTGGNSGIGKGIVARFLAEGAQVAFCGRDAAKGAAALAEFAAPDRTAFFQADLANEAAAKGVIDKSLAQFGRLDVLVNNAGFGARRSGIERGDGLAARWRKMLGGNLDAPYFMASYALPHLKTGGKGAIVNISSTATFHGNWGSYGVAKAGVEALTRALAAEGAPFGIRTNSISPGWIKSFDTGGLADWEKGASLLGRMGTVDEIAQAVLFLASDAASFITGTTLIVDGGMMVTDYPSLPFLEEAEGWKLFSGALEEKP